MIARQAGRHSSGAAGNSEACRENACKGPGRRQRSRSGRGERAHNRAEEQKELSQNAYITLYEVA